MAVALSYKTYLINMDRSADRLAMMKKEFEKTGIQDFIRISAVDGKLLDPSEYRVDNHYDRKLVPGEIGCYLSHVKVKEEFLKSGADFAVILEDDAVLAEDFKYITEKAMAEYSRLPKNKRWDVLKLFNGKRMNIPIEQLDEKYFIGLCGTSIPITTIAAIWTVEGAKKFLKQTLEDEVPVIRRPIDCDLQHPWEYDLLIYNLLPSVVWGADVPTEIQYNIKLRKSEFFPMIGYEIKRFFPKYQYYIKREGWSKFLNHFVLGKSKIVS